ncbi:MAG: hypothetical protein AVDCRST_MAG88-4112, partial [uncultured Thermomicrobiales bacterium]
MPLPPISEATIRQYASPGSFERGRRYQREGAVLSLVWRGEVLSGEVEGSEPAPYRVRVVFDAGGVAGADCSCPHEWGGWCKHIVATLLAAREGPGAIEERPTLDAALAGLEPDQLRALLLRLVEREPRLLDAIEGELTGLTAAPATGAASGASGPRPRRTPVDVSAVRCQVRAAVGGGYSRSSYDYDDVVAPGEVESVLGQARAFVLADDGATALAVLEALTDEYARAWHHYDDSDGEVSDFFYQLGPVWAEAILTADLTPDERAEWADKLTAWQEDLGDYGVDDALDVAIEAARQGWDDPAVVRALAGEGRAATVTTAPRGDASRQDVDLDDEDEDADDVADDDDELYNAGEPLYLDTLAVARLNVLERRGRFDEYLNLARVEGQTARYVTMLVRLGRAEEAVAYGREHLATPDEALILATALRETGEVARALAVGEHGLTLGAQADSATIGLYGYGRAARKGPLATWLRDVAAAAGEGPLALRAAEIAFREEMSLVAYLRAAELAGEGWPALRAELLGHLH